MFKAIKEKMASLFGGNPTTSNANTSESPPLSDETSASPTPLSSANIDLSELPFDPDALRLEALFAHASHEARKRSEFITELLKAEVLVLGQSEPADGGRSQNVQLATQVIDQEPVALVFTSVKALVIAGGRPDQAHVRLPIQELMRMIRGQLGFVLNPGNSVGKVFTRAEVEQLAGGPEKAPGDEADEDLQISVGQPNEYPNGMREALASAIEVTPRIDRIHTGLMTAGKQKPVFLAVITTKDPLDQDDFMKLINEMGTHIGSKLQGQAINFAPMDDVFADLVERGALLDVKEVQA